MVTKIYYLFVLLLCFSGYVNSDVLCETGFCENYISETGCSATAVECGINNATHSGLWLPSPTICSCCTYCLPFISADDYCTLGGPGLGTTIGRCGNGLNCTEADNGEYTCTRMDTACHRAQDSFDISELNGETGALQERPECDGKGRYATVACVPTQSCFCQSEEGERLFGEVLYSGANVKQNMHCGCSRLHEKIKKIISSVVPYPVVGPRCSPDGDFYPIQCLDRVCYCVNPVTGLVIDGDNNHVDLDTDPITSLECYDSNLDLYPEQSEGEPPYNFTTTCVENMYQVIELIDQSVEDGYNVDYFSGIPTCEPDGTFGRISTSRNRTKICVDDRGRKIGEYEAFPGTTEYDNMDCKCAYTSHVVMASEQEKPVCCSNGNFRPIQCRRGMCRCVDSDGRQTAQENSDPAWLSCYTHDWRSC